VVSLRSTTGYRLESLRLGKTGDAWIYERYMRMAGTPPVCDLFLRHGSGGVARSSLTTGYRLASLRLGKMGDECMVQQK
jgi:hypothetical protein